MSTRTSPYNQATVPVLDRHGTPLAPAKPSRVRRWLESGRANKVWLQGIFAVQLHDLDADNAALPPMALNLNPGETAGIAITRESSDHRRRDVVGGYEHRHRNREITREITDRRRCRRTRRGRLRHRPARFHNRANSRTKGKLPPSVQSIVDDIAQLVDTMRRLYPISQIRAEYLRFDTQLMQNPDIRGMQYLRGTLHGWQLRHYILHRDDWLCRYCGKPGTKQNNLELDHVVPLSAGGPSVVGNLVAACRRCNQKKDNQRVEDFLAADPVRLADVRHQLEQVVPLTAVGRLNSAMPAILDMLDATGLPMTISDGASTSYTRHQLGIAKSHVNDAACLDRPTAVAYRTNRTTLLHRQRRHKRKSINSDIKGSPNSKEFPAYSCLPRCQQGYTTPPAHSVGPRRLRGIRSGDLVRIHHRSGHFYTGRATLDLKARQVKIKRTNAPTVSATPARTTLVAHATRWSVAYCNTTVD